MEDRKLKLIAELMEELGETMEYSEDDFNSRLGREPKVEVVKMEGDMPEEEGMEVMAGMDEMMDPEEKLKARLMKMRGEF